MLDSIIPMLAGPAATTVAGAVFGLAYHHILVPLNEALRTWGGPAYTGRRPALAIAHSCVSEHDPEVCPCRPWRRRTVLEYQGADWQRRRYAVPGTYRLEAEVTVRVGYRGNRPYPLTPITAFRCAHRGAAMGAALGLFYAALLWFLLYL
ncbi:hypothetical protein HGA13_26050 [Nocardia speluncae]|uniref:Uncharacterized protein n=1 Tax=Nocardia speluncae TaxID=419477 RepID=A0A846XP89_9NOCA|nr:hypothetical protein [Nocardia speluncae]NKY36506.1 hypothetical protein [Nocardia speluncae]